MPPNCQTLYNIIQSSYFAECGDANYDKRSDLDKNKVVDILDFGIFRGNWANSGGDAWCLQKLNDPTDPCYDTTTTTISVFSVTNFACSSSNGCHSCRMEYSGVSSQKYAMFLFTDADGKVRKGAFQDINIGSSQIPTTFCCDALVSGAYKVSYWIYTDSSMKNLILWSGSSQKKEVSC